MTRNIAFVLFLSAVTAAFAGAESEPLKNGLTDFDKPDSSIWSVKDGVLTGRSNEKMKGSMVFTKAVFKDVEMTCEFLGRGFKAGKHSKVPAENYDSGLFFRNKNKIQVQFGISRSLKKDMTGSLYVAGGGYKYQAKDGATHHKAGEWNTLKVRLEGEAVHVWLNGTEVLNDRIPDHREAGPIGVQLHGGVDMEIKVKDLKIKEL